MSVSFYIKINKRTYLLVDTIWELDGIIPGSFKSLTTTIKIKRESLMSGNHSHIIIHHYHSTITTAIDIRRGYNRIIEPLLKNDKSTIDL